MDYRDALEYLYRLRSRGMRLDLDRVRAALAHVGNPERGMRIAHVAGTNGKGSVSAMLAAVLHAGGHKVGLFTSPHLHTFNERIQVDGTPIGERTTTQFVERIASEPVGSPLHDLTFFETTFLIAMLVFREARCTAVVLETGMGGRLDATNVVEPDVTIITSVDLDHQAYLGATYGEIAHEKAGILKPGVPLVAAVENAEARRVIVERANTLGIAQRWFGRDIAVTSPSASGAFAVRVGDVVVRDLVLGLQGAHQRVNAALAVAAALELRARGIELANSDIAHGLAAVHWPGRLELIAGKPSILLDGAHNPHGCRALATFLAELDDAPTRRVLVFGCARDKDAAGMLAALGDDWHERIYTRPPVDRGLDPESLRDGHPGRIVPSVADALADAQRAAGPDGLVVVSGSLFLVAAVRAQLLGLPSDPPIAL